MDLIAETVTSCRGATKLQIVASCRTCRILSHLVGVTMKQNGAFGVFAAFVLVHFGAFVAAPLYGNGALVRLEPGALGAFGAFVASGWCDNEAKCRNLSHLSHLSPNATNATNPPNVAFCRICRICRIYCQMRQMRQIHQMSHFVTFVAFGAFGAL